MKDFAVADAEGVDSCRALSATDSRSFESCRRTRFYCLRDFVATMIDFRFQANRTATSHQPVWSLFVRSLALEATLDSFGYSNLSVHYVSGMSITLSNRTHQDW